VTVVGVWASQSPESPLALEQRLVSPVPLWMTIEKLRGFVADHQAKIVNVEGNHVQLLVEDGRPARRRRSSDRPTVFQLDVQLTEEQTERRDETTGSTTAWVRTRIHVVVIPQKNRDRRQEDVSHRARQVLLSLRSYLMAAEEETPASQAIAVPGEPEEAAPPAEASEIS